MAPAVLIFRRRRLDRAEAARERDAAVRVRAGSPRTPPLPARNGWRRNNDSLCGVQRVVRCAVVQCAGGASRIHALRGSAPLWPRVGALSVAKTERIYRAARKRVAGIFLAYTWNISSICHF